MKGTKAAGRYAQALLELALEKNNVDQVLADLKYLLEVHEQSMEFELLLKSPIVNSEKKIAVLKELFGQFEDLTSSFVTMITKNGREKDLPLIASKFDQLVKENRGIVSVTLTTAVQADDTTKKAIFSKLEKKYKGTFDITEKIDSSIIGGFIVRVGDDQIDASIASQLNNLKQRLTR